MNNWYDRNMSLTDSIIRYILGSAIILGVLMLTLKVWVSLGAVYLINTALMRWDPTYVVFAKFRKVIAVKIGEPVIQSGKPVTNIIRNIIFGSLVMVLSDIFAGKAGKL